MKKTKILATYGPAIATPEKIRELISKGANAFRVNCSHGSTSDFETAATVIREGSQGSEFPIGLLFDISGPKLRLDRFSGELEINDGESLTLTVSGTDLATRRVAVNHPAVIPSVKKGERLFIDDGQLRFDIIETGKESVTLRAIHGGTLLPAKGINLPDTELQTPTITAKDEADLETAVRLQADFVALSFVRSGDDIIHARKLIKKFGGSQKIIAKLEKREAIEALDEIVLLSDGVMIARGDLGVELPPEELPRLQKRIIRLANQHFKPVIVATQMLESMRFSPRATRAEISDVATAVFDFADAVMLSAETATGQYPAEAVAVMHDVITATESSAIPAPIVTEDCLVPSAISHAIARSVSQSHDLVDSKAIFAFTSSGFTAGMISNFFPPQPVIALTSSRKVMNQLTLFRSVYAVEAPQPDSFEAMIDIVDRVSKSHKLADIKSPVIITGGVPFGSTVPTNFMMFHEVS